MGDIKILKTKEQKYREAIVRIGLAMSIISLLLGITWGIFALMIGVYSFKQGEKKWAILTIVLAVVGIIFAL